MCVTENPPSHTISLPADIAALLTEAATGNLTGHITLFYVGGQVGSVEVKRQRTIRKELTPQRKRA